MDVPDTNDAKNKINEYVAKGYLGSYVLENGKLKDLKTNKLFSPQEVTIEESYRYEGVSNPSKITIMYAIHTDDGRKGTMLLPLGQNSDLNLESFINEVILDMKKREE